MKIDLQNFFRYYDEKNPKHRAAVDQLEVDIDPKLLDDSANWVRIYRTPVGGQSSFEILLNIPWYPQTDNYLMPDRTCNSSSCAMCLEFLKPSSLPTGPKGDDSYLRKVLSIGDSTDHTVQTKALLSYGLKSTFRYNMNFSDLDFELASGRPVVMGILHRGSDNAPNGSGHMVVCIGKTNSGDYIFRDPYGSIHSNYTGPVSEGKQVIYSKKMLAKRWTVKNPNDGWARVFNV